MRQRMLESPDNTAVTGVLFSFSTTHYKARRIKVWIRIMTMPLLLAMLLSFTACGGGSGLPSAEEIVKGVTESQEDIKSHQFEIDMSMEAAGEAEGEAFEMAMTLGFSGAIDIENEEMSADVYTSTEMTGEDDTEMTVEMYLIDDTTTYSTMDMPEMETMWMQQEVSEGDWEEMIEVLSPIESHLELLELAEVRVIGSEEVKGVDCYVLQLTPDLEQLWETVMQQTEAADMGVPAIAEEALQEALISFSVKQWVTKDAYFLAKSEIDISMELTPEVMGVVGGEGMMIMDITLSFLIYDHNQPVSILLPPETKASGFIQQGRDAAETELTNIQAAMVDMMVDNNLTSLPNPVTIATNDMSAFPDTSVCGADKINDWDGNAYQSGDKDGYILYQHDIDADNTQNNLVNYIVSRYTTGTYAADVNGTVTQVTTGEYQLP